MVRRFKIKLVLGHKKKLERGRRPMPLPSLFKVKIVLRKSLKNAKLPKKLEKTGNVRKKTK